MSFVIGLLVIGGICTVIVIVMILRAPEGREVPGVGFVQKKKDK